METLSTWYLSGGKSGFCKAFNKQDGSFLIPLLHKQLRKLLLLVLLTEVTPRRQSVISTSLGEYRTWLFKSQQTMSKIAGIFDSGRQERSSRDNSSGWDKPPMIM